MFSGFRKLIGWGALALYATTTSLCHLAHDSAAHATACCAHAGSRAQEHAGPRLACHQPGHTHHGAHDDHSHEHGHAGHESPVNSGVPEQGTPTHDGHSCVVCQYLADPPNAASFVVVLAPTGVVAAAPVDEPLAVPQAARCSYSSRAPPVVAT